MLKKLIDPLNDETRKSKICSFFLGFNFNEKLSVEIIDVIVGNCNGMVEAQLSPCLNYLAKLIAYFLIYKEWTM